MKTIETYDIVGESDTTEGRGPSITVARFSKSPPALEFALRYGGRWTVMGCPMAESAVRHSSLLVFDTVEEACEELGIETPAIKQAKANALSKLTPQERKLLGL